MRTILTCASTISVAALIPTLLPHPGEGAQKATRSLEDACRLGAARKLGVFDVRRASARFDALGIGKILSDRPKGEVPGSTKAAAIHEACYLCFIGLKVGTLTRDETLGDMGLVHRLA